MTQPSFGDRVQETFTTTGTGTISLGGAVTGYQAFSSIVANAGTCYYAATDGTNWEVGLGTYATSGDTLARTTILASSNSGSAVSWAAGTKNIWLDFPAYLLTNKLFDRINSQVFTSSGTYTPTTGAVYAIAEVQGGGGGGGGAGGSSGVGGGGGAGGYARALLTAAQIGSSQTVTINSGGSSGSSGGSVTFGSLISANGGSAGSAGSGLSQVAGGGGGSSTVSTGQAMNSATGAGGGVSSAATSGSFSGQGASSYYGSGGISLINNGVGTAASGYGAGGAGGFNSSNSGGAGTNGIVIVTEFIAN